MEKHLLSKSTFLRGIQCEKSLYLYKNFIQLRDQPSAEQQAIFSRGNNVGILAQKLFPGGADATPARRSDNIAAVQKTKELIEQGVEVIYEAAFQYDKVLAILDILVRKDGKWYAYEVKSSLKISNAYLLDASLQYWVITNSGLVLEDISLITLNGQYIRQGELELAGLFSKTSVLKDVLKNQENISLRSEKLKQVAMSAAMPDVAIGEHCFSPYNCDFMGNCWKNVPKNSVFEIGSISKQEQFALYSSGIRLVDEIPAKNNLDKKVNIHVQSFKSQEVYFDKEELGRFVGQVNYPLCFMDFETFMPAVPLFEGTKPYQHLPFQFSIHRIEKEGAQPEHFEFLAEPGSDPRKQFLEKLVGQLEGVQTILVYDAIMERNVLNSLKKDFPSFCSNIDLILSKLLDLMKVFQERFLYHSSMKNSHSIKNVLPAFLPELSYEGLKISSGSIAMIEYEKLRLETDMFKLMEVKEQLLEYCKLDTYAMVRLFEVIKDFYL